MGVVIQAFGGYLQSFRIDAAHLLTDFFRAQVLGHGLLVDDGYALLDGAGAGLQVQVAVGDFLVFNDVLKRQTLDLDAVGGLESLGRSQHAGHLFEHRQAVIEGRHLAHQVGQEGVIAVAVAHAEHQRDVLIVGVDVAAALEAVDAADAGVFDAQHAVLVHAVKQSEAVLNLVGVYVFARLVDDDILAAAFHIHAHTLFQAHDVSGFVPAFCVQVGSDELAVL